MQQGPIKKLWVVTDPTPVSEIGDILFETDAAGLILQIRGGLAPKSHPALYLDRPTAEIDALARLAFVRGLAASAAGSTKGDLRQATRVALLVDAGRVVLEADLRQGSR